MINKPILAITVAAAILITGGLVFAPTLAQVLQVTNARSILQVAALTASTPATYSNPSGVFEPMPSTSLNMTLKFKSALIVTFSARGVVAPPVGTTVPIVFVKCVIDGVPCEPNGNAVEFLYPTFCCDTRSFTWVVHNATSGPHNITIEWGMGNPTSAIITERSLVVEAARL